MKKMNKTLLVCMAFILVTGLLSGVALADEHQAQLQVVHAVEGGAQADVYVNGEMIVKGIGFSQASEIIQRESGSLDIEWYQTGSKAEADLLLKHELQAEAGVQYFISAAGDAEAMEALTLENQAASEGQSKLRVIHAAAADIEELNIELAGIDVEGVNRLTASEYIEIDPTETELHASINGLVNQILQSPQVSLKADSVYSLMVSGTADDLKLWLVTEAGAAAEGDIEAAVVIDAVIAGESEVNEDMDSNSGTEEEVKEGTEVDAGAEAETDTEVDAAVGAEAEDEAVVPEGMPQTGMGGMSQNGNTSAGVTWIAAILFTLLSTIGWVSYKRAHVK